jgi:hypothetical protein
MLMMMAFGGMVVVGLWMVVFRVAKRPRECETNRQMFEKLLQEPVEK